MADTKISALASKVTPAATDLLVIVDVSDLTMAASGTDKQATVAAVAPVRSVAGRTGAVTLAAADVGLGSVTNDVQTKAAVVPNTAPAAGQVLAGNAGGTAYAPVSVSGDGTLTSTGALSVTKTGGVAFAASATTDATNAANIASGTLAVARGGTGQATAAAAFGALSPLTTKGDLLSFGTANGRLGVGTDGQVLTADSVQTLGVKWAAAGGGGSTAQVVTVAASNSPSRYSGATYTCSGVNDVAQINAALASVAVAVANEAVTAPTFTLINNCDSATGFTATGSATVALDTSVKQFGTGSISVTPGAGNNPGLSLGSLSVSISGADYLNFWCKSPAVGEFNVVLTCSDPGSFSYTTKIKYANQWVYVSIPLAGNYYAHSGIRGTLTTLAINLVSGGSNSTNPPAASEFWIDQIGVSTRKMLANPLVHPQSITLTTNPAGTTYAEGTDYAVNYDEGELIVYPSGAITSAQSLLASYNRGGGTVKLCSGTYNITGTLSYYPYTDIDLTDGAVLVLTTPSGWSDQQVFIGPINSARQSRHVTIRGGTLIGAKEAVGDLKAIFPVQFRNFVDARLLNTAIRGFTSGVWATGASTAVNTGFLMEGCDLENVGGGFADITGTYYGAVDAAFFSASLGGMSVRVDYTEHVRVAENVVRDTPNDGVLFFGCNQTAFVGNVLKNIGMGGINVTNQSATQGLNFSVAGNTLLNCGSRSITVETSAARGTISGNLIDGAGREGVWLHGCSNVVVSANSINSCGLKVAIDGSSNASNYAITVSGTGNIITGNVINVSSTYCAAAINNSGTLTSVFNNVYPGTQVGYTEAGTSIIFEPTLSAVTSTINSTLKATGTANLQGTVNVGTTSTIMNSTRTMNLQVSGGGNAGLALRTASATSTDSALIELAHAHGTAASPTAITAGDRLSTILNYGVETGNTFAPAAEISCFAAAVGAGGVEGELRFACATSTGTTRNNRLRANNTGCFINLAASDPGSAALNNSEVVFYLSAGAVWVRTKDGSGTSLNLQISN